MTTVRVEQNVPSNNGTVIGIQNVHEIQRMRGTALTEPWVRGCLAYYVPADDTTSVLSAILNTDRVAVIHGDTGTGRYTTALHILKTLRVTTIRQVRRAVDDKVELDGLKDDETGWILDLRHETKPLPASFGLDLRDARKRLEDASSFLVVVISTDAWSGVCGEATHLAHPLRPVDPIAVARAYLERQVPPIGETDIWLADEGITAHLMGATPAKAVEWARTITTAVSLNSKSPDPKGIAELVAFVVQSAQKWRRDLLHWHRQNTDSGHRNYLLAAAVLDGAPAQNVFEAYTALGSALGDTPAPTKGQHGPGIIELTDTIKAELGEDDRVRFLKPGYAEAVVDYFWADRPHHVKAFTRWTADQATALPRDLATPLADHVAQWTVRFALAKQSLRVLRATATHWAASTHLKDHAADLLVAAALDPVTGRLARDRYLTWAKGPDAPAPGGKAHTPVTLKQALAKAMAQLAPAYPDIALTRLATLAACTESLDVTQTVGDALMILWDQDTFEDSIRERLSSWLTSSLPHQSQAASRTFLHLAERVDADNVPVLLTVRQGRLDPWALTGWRHSLDGPTPQIQTAFNAWLDAALAHSQLRPVILNAFTDAIFRPGPDPLYLANRLLVLQHAANGWEPAHAGQPHTERTRLRDELLLAMRAADPAAPAPAPTDAPTPR
ncbi:hypothetical protein [Streptomyces gardneri]|uniref:hypothetical protein n=1 Tax=Streptomyces gardneri TaxID=66892 RepID=UPI0034045E90